jgi:hypothetical protein
MKNALFTMVFVVLAFMLGYLAGGRGTVIQHSSLIGLFGAMSSRRYRSRPMVRQAGFILRSAVGAEAAAR